MSDQTQDKLWSDEAIGRTVREYCSYRVADTILCMSQGAAHSLLTEIRDDYEQRLAAVSAERDELQASFDLRWNADMKAIARWQESTGRELVWPDHADLCVWLMQEIKRVGAERDELRQELAECAEVAGALARQGDDIVKWRKHAGLPTRTTPAAGVTQLEPCPFCGGEASIKRTDTVTFVFCATRDCVGPSASGYSDGEAFAAWNRRAGEERGDGASK
jgi:hypothetical protein